MEPEVSLQPVHALSQMNPLHILSLCISKAHFNNILLSTP
jgi:hypothetical protein